MTLPTKGAIEWAWGHYVFPQQSGQPVPLHLEPQGRTTYLKAFTRSMGVVSRRMVNPNGSLHGTWTYQQGLNAGQQPIREGTTTVTDPLGHRTVHYFSVYSCKPEIQPDCPNQNPDPSGFSHQDYGLPFTRNTTDGTGTRFLSSEVRQGASTVKRRTYLRYENSGYNYTSGTHINHRVASSRTVFVDDGNRVADVTHSSFDGHGNYRTTTTGGNFPAGNVRTTHTELNPGRSMSSILGSGEPWILGTFTHRQVTEAGATARTEACFDAATGFLRRTRTLASGTTRGTTDLVARYTPDASGNVTAEEFFGGDTQAVGTGGLCGLALPVAQYTIDHTHEKGSLKSTQYPGQTFKVADFDIDPSTGLVKTSRDVSGLATSFVYDAMGRLTSVRPAQEGWTDYVYTNASGTATPAKAFIKRRPNGGGTPLAEEEVHFDPFGRVAVERRKLADGAFSSRTTTYHPQGWLKSRSEWGTSAATQYLFPDPFGRPTTIRPPDGAAHDVTLSYNGVRQVSRTVKIGTAWNGTAVTESSSTTTEIYDRQGRLSQVQEPSNPDGSNATTTYLYDVGGRLKEVSQTAKSLAGVSFTQQRKFTFDHRGFLTWEQHPEKGAAGNGTVTYSGYDARGHAGQVVDGGNTLRFTYDGAERLTAVEESVGFGAWRPVRTFTYATTNALPNRRLGKLEVARAYNHVVLGGTPHTVEVTETYTYAGKQGRVSKRDTATAVTSPFTSVLGSFTQSWTWNDLGDRASTTYPRCTHAGCAATTNRTVTPAYTHGFLTAVPGYTSATAPSGRPITYHPNGQVHQILRANGTTDTYTKDPQNQPRPRRIEARVASTGSQLWDSGEHAFDGAGNLTRAGAAYFLYDRVSRVTAGRVEIPGEGCGEELLLASGTDNTTKTYQSCGTVRAQGSYGVGPSGQVTLRAGSRVVLGDGFSVASGGRLTAETDPSLDPGGGSTLASFGHAYDGLGNLQSLSANGAQRNTPTGAATNRLQGFHVGYDAAGNLTSWSGATYEYNALNQTWRTANGAQDWIHFYTADGERILSYSPGGPFSRFTVRDLDGKVLTELNVDNAVSTAMTLQRDYVYRGSQLLSAHTADPSPEDLVHFHLDHLGTPRAITDRNSTVLAEHVYYPSGEEGVVAVGDGPRGAQVVEVEVDEVLRRRVGGVG
ncbi:MAG TPA: hypothetical protein VLF66_03025 [Thermoanaerobaculia bacterium]|nr:hypothetical protein [Thermoanaerobaculia bacterium]